jgi:pimeloyl-ACP methyl ester carboxylesterase
MQGDTQPFEQFADTPEGKIHYLDWGGMGYPAHFLHANGFCSGAYGPLFAKFGGMLRIIASDIRGHGDSIHPGTGRIRHWRIFADDLQLLINSVMSPPVIGMGHSLGAVATYIAAARYRRLFSAVILIDPPILPLKKLWLIRLAKRLGQARRIPLAQLARRRKRVFRSKEEAFKRFSSGRGMFKTWSDEFIHAYLECGLLEKDENQAVLKCDPELEAQIFESIPLDAWRYAGSIRCPVLALRGEHSETFLPEAARRLGRLIGDYTLHTIPDSGHFIPMEKPETCARLILEFIRQKVGLV